jgi:glycerol-3-phosphate acyltransferase PlsY
LGSVPFGILITRLMGLGDLRQIGSGNIGATNVLRTGNKGAAAATLVLDGAKSAVAVLVARAMVGEDAAQVAGLMAFLGHLFPVWLRFKGGKGVATFLGAMLALAWPVGLALCGTWLVVAVVSRVSSLAALMSAALAGLWVFYFERFDLLAITLVFTVCVYARHWANLQRLKAGTEPKIGAKKA